MNAWHKRDEPSPEENGTGGYAYPSTRPTDASNSGSMRGLFASVSSRFDARPQTLGVLLYAVGALAVVLLVHGGWFELPGWDTRALDRVVFAGAVLVWSVWFFPWHRFGRNVLLVPVSAALALVTLAVYFSGGWQSPLSVCYLFVVVLCAGYFSTRVASVCAAVALLASLTPQLYGPNTARMVEFLVVQAPIYGGIVLACRHALWERAKAQSESDSARIRDLEERLRHEASVDPLTDLYNRCRFEARFGEEFERARRTGEQFMVLFVDVDDFKLVNDTHGHRTGDEALKLVADVLQACSRRIDAVARHGGDEFLVMLPGASPPEARSFFDRIRDRVVESSRSNLGFELRLSAGAVRCPGYAEDPATLLDAADEAMYRAKRRGKNRLFEVPSPTPAGHRSAASPEG